MSFQPHRLLRCALAAILLVFPQTAFSSRYFGPENIGARCVRVVKSLLPKIVLPLELSDMLIVERLLNIERLTPNSWTDIR